MWKLVGFDGRLKIPEQQRVFRMIPGLGAAEFLRFCFQAEDGIRDSSVTGVQTCALPIWSHVPGGPALRPARRVERGAPGRPRAQIGRASCRERVSTSGGDARLTTKGCFASSPRAEGGATNTQKNADTRTTSTVSRRGATP